MRAKEDAHPRPTFLVVRIRQHQIESDNHFSDSTVDVDEVVTVPANDPICANRVNPGWHEARGIRRSSKVRPSNDTSGIGDHGIGEAEGK